MSCFESLFKKLSISKALSILEGLIYSRSVLGFQFLYFLALSKHISQMCCYKRERNNYMWWLSKLSLLVTEKREL